MIFGLKKKVKKENHKMQIGITLINIGLFFVTILALFMIYEYTKRWRK